MTRWGDQPVKIELHITQGELGSLLGILSSYAERVDELAGDGTDEAAVSLRQYAEKARYLRGLIGAAADIAGRRR